MNYYERIPVKTAKLELQENPVYVNCEGLEVTVCAENGDVNITARVTDSVNNAYVLKSGENITLSGSFALSGNASAARLLYCKLL